MKHLDDFIETMGKRSDVDAFMKTYKKLLKSKQAATKKLNAANTELYYHLENCPHPVIETRTEYSPGGYDYKSKTEQWTECTLCKKRLKTFETIYGGFQ